jgi:hypothetical protein
MLRPISLFKTESTDGRDRSKSFGSSVFSMESSQTQERIGRLARLKQSRKSLLTVREANTYTRINRGEPSCAAFF